LQSSGELHFAWDRHWLLYDLSLNHGLSRTTWQSRIAISARILDIAPLLNIFLFPFRNRNIVPE